MGHDIENTDDTPLRFLEMVRSSRHADVSLNQWTALTPAPPVKEHLNLSDATITALRRQKQQVTG